jgi:hypothetical protein
MLRFLILHCETSCREPNDTCTFHFGSFLISHSLYKYLILKRCTLHKICSSVCTIGIQSNCMYHIFQTIRHTRILWAVFIGGGGRT